MVFEFLLALFTACLVLFFVSRQTMELWGTLTKSAFGWTSGPSASTDSSTTATRASNEYIDKFFDTCNPAGACQQEAMKDFVSRISEANPERKVAVVTSGSTVVPLNSTRFIDSPTSGYILIFFSLLCKKQTDQTNGFYG